MYKINKNISFEFLKGKELLQICVGKYQMIFNFEDSISVSIESKFILKLSHDYYERWESSSKDIPIRTFELLNHKIVDVFIPNEMTLQLIFENGDEMMIYDSKDNYESFQVTHKAGCIIV
jgi:hypothetical protein